MAAYPIKEMKAGEILDVSIRLCRDHFKPAFLIVCCLMLPVHLLQNTVEYYAEQETFEAVLSGQVERQAETVMIKGGASLLNIILRLVAEPLTTGALVYLFTAFYLGKTATTGEAWKIARERWGSLLGASIVYGLVVVLGFILLIIPGVYWAMKYSLYAQLIVVERRTAMDFFERSGKLMKDNYSTAFVLGLLLVVGFSLIIIGSAFIPVPAVSVILMSVFQAGFILAGSATSVVFFYSCLCKHENFDLKVLAAESAADAAQPEASPAGPV